MLSRLFQNAVTWRELLLAILPTAAVAWLLARTARVALTRVIRSVVRDTVLVSSPVVRAPLRLVGLAVFILLFGLLIVPAFELVGVRPRVGVHLRTLTAWAFGSGLRVVLIVAIAYVMIRVVNLVVQRFEHELDFGTGVDALERAKRARTLGAVLTSTTAIIVGIVAFLMILREFRLDIGPALTTAGIAGVALGFGAQTLVRDLIGGFFLILENQVRVGDVASINGVGGLVEEINLRTIVLRDYDGTVYTIPNGAISMLANKSREFAFAVVELPTPYPENTDRVMDLLREIGAGLERDERFAPSILAPLEIAGVEAFADSDVKIKMRMKTVPLKQWEIARELRRRIKEEFDRNGIDIPLPQMVVHLANAGGRSQ
ncbi:MAG TPA: mechanosensitive ion channel family protein [Vicinamibacterales bacterium]|nr:mechanosensitive ion channel family protein [Vicinamibacterales bacterium]